jgi:hypothetical protein
MVRGDSAKHIKQNGVYSWQVQLCADIATQLNSRSKQISHPMSICDKAIKPLLRENGLFS